MELNGEMMDRQAHIAQLPFLSAVEYPGGHGIDSTELCCVLPVNITEVNQRIHIQIQKLLVLLSV